MTEATLTSKLKEATLSALPPPRVFIKHAEPGQSGIPDLSVTWKHRTEWVEVKYVRARSTVRAEVTKHPIQLATMRMLELAGANAVYLIYHEHGKKQWSTTLWLPSVLDVALRDGIANPIPRRPSFAMPVSEAVYTTGGFSYASLDHELLAIFLEGLRYDK